MVIPTWNEERLLPDLLRRVRASPHVGQVIVADACSDDTTVQIAEAAAALVVAGGRPAVGRNVGSRSGSSEYLLFLDADVQVDTEIIAQVAAVLSDSAVSAVHPRLVPLTAKRFVRLCYRVLDRYAQFCSRIHRPQGIGALIAVRRSAFEAVGGFDESVQAGEDSHFFGQLGRRVGGVVYCRDIELPVSARRFELESPLWFAAKNLLWAPLRLAGLRVSVIPYTWRRYP
ncbi:glycosyltransferase [Streptomyces sp. NPDC007162]|uniref:glycosyltransferase n=1 Tax=Streptomyces sp. NPDC007162 TaxID=3156917 RepID=UPI0033F62EBE